MAPLAAEDMAMNNQTYDGKERDASDVLYQNLAKGVQSVKNGEVYTIDDALLDIKNTKTYILQTFMYKEYAENFSKKMKSAMKSLDPFAE